MSRHLFLGGPWDGQVHEVEDGAWHWVVPAPVDRQTFAWELYTAHRVYLQPPTFQHGEALWWRIFVVGALPDPDDVMNLLCQHDMIPEG